MEHDALRTKKTMDDEKKFSNLDSVRAYSDHEILKHLDVKKRFQKIEGVPKYWY